MLRSSRMHGTIQTKVEYWPSYVDILTTVLMVFLLQSFLQTTMNIDNLETAHIRQSQDALKKAFLQEFKTEVENRKITFDSKPNLLQIRFSEEVLFASGNYKLAQRGQDLLVRCTRLLLRPETAHYEQIEVQGHTDNQKLESAVYPRNNWELSSARALEVVQFSIKNNMPAEKLSVGGYAEFRPVDNSAAGRPLNRRIELRIVFSTPHRKIEGAR